MITRKDIESSESVERANRRNLSHERKNPYDIRSILQYTFIVLSTLLLLFIVKPYYYSHHGINQFNNLHSTASNFSHHHLSKRFHKDEACEDIKEVAFSEQCSYALTYCETESLINYMSFYYCSRIRWLNFTGVVIWLFLLFATIGIAASDFFCPNLATIAKTLHMSESATGVTFLAFGNGSPDVFSTFAAMKADSASLAIGELIGAAAFITAVVSGAMAIVHPFRVAKRSFIRDVIFFLGAVMFTGGFLADGRLLPWESTFMICFYAFYVSFVLLGGWIMQRRKDRRLRNLSMRSHYAESGTEQDRLSISGDDEEVDENAQLLSPAASLVRSLGENYLDDSDDEVADEDMARGFADINTNMSILRNSSGDQVNHGRRRSVRKSNIRPSLVGALEFRSAVRSLSTASAGDLTLSARRHRQGTNDSSIANEGQGRARSSSHVGHNPTRPPMVRNSNSLPNDSDLLTIHSYDETYEMSKSPEMSPKDALPPQTQSLPPPLSLNTNLPPPILSNDSPDNLTVPQSRELLLSPGSALTPQIVLSPNEWTEEDQSKINDVGNEDTDVDVEAKKLSPVMRVLVVLFPTLHDFRRKGIFDKIISFLSVIPVFLLTITLPVVDSPEELPDEDGGDGVQELVADALEDELGNKKNQLSWIRWLTGVQCVCAPVFCVAVSARLVLLAILLTITSPDKPPKFQKVLCIFGFIISTVWISTVANEVVGILQSFGIIAGISEAILGLTVFAVGNSLGDLVADVTVANMGYPMMAFSACFGGPMLNILLGIGIGGLYVTLTTHASSYPIDVSVTLIISCVCLILTLIGMLIFVPLHKFQMTKSWGYCLIGFFCVTTLINLILEVTGFE